MFIIDSWSPGHTFTFSQMKCKCLFDNGNLKEFSLGLHFLFAFIISTSLTVPKNWNIILVSTYGAMVHLSELSHQKNRLSHLHCHVSLEYIFIHGTTLDVRFHIHGFCHGTMGKPITWQNPYTMTFAMVYGLCHRSMAKPIGYPIPAWTRGAKELAGIISPDPSFFSCMLTFTFYIQVEHPAPPLPPPPCLLCSSFSLAWK